MHPGLVSPTDLERCMQVAFDEKVNSGCISRQVGAVVTDEHYNIMSVGWNDVHTNSKIPCIYRSIEDLQKQTEKVKKDPKAKCSLYSEFELDYYCFKTVYNTIEHKNNLYHSRAIHAEAKAFLDCDKTKVKGGYLFTTSSSCENCTIKTYSCVRWRE